MGGFGAGCVLLTVHQLLAVGEHDAEVPAAPDKTAWCVLDAVAAVGCHGSMAAVWDGYAEMHATHAAAGLGLVPAVWDLAGQMVLADSKAGEAWLRTVLAAVLGADEGPLLLGSTGLLGASLLAATFAVEGTVAVGWVPGVDAEGRVFVARGLASVFLAEGRVDLSVANLIPHMLAVTPHGLASLVVGHHDG